MDTGYDFITPEFFNILFFQQKNLILFPYVDLKHLKMLEIFAEGYSIIDVDATAFHELSSVIGHEAKTAYGQKPVLYLIYNIGIKGLRQIMNMPNIRYIINTNENIEELIDDGSIVFYNKKTKRFYNYDETPLNLKFETSIISNSRNQQLLSNKIQNIKNVGALISTAINEGETPRMISGYLKRYDLKYWNKILQFTRFYYGIEIPQIPIKFSNPEPKIRSDESDITHSEYNMITSFNTRYAQEFIPLLREYWLEMNDGDMSCLEKFLHPKNLYVYLRRTHWKNGIPSDFLKRWMKMEITSYKLTKEDRENFNQLFKKLNITETHEVHRLSIDNIEAFPITVIRTNEEISNNSNNNSDFVPNPKENFILFKQWFLKKLDELDRLLTARIS